MNKIIYILAIIIPIVLIFALKSEKTDQISAESSTDESIGAADSILTIINNFMFCYCR